uniref:Small ribosomal subunit protein mS23 n=1 Tax=Pipistrellus kuhlii TaxID=59472 RepID=A0A7J7TK81_PIPKU|nr:mitochondrial ribosomal protein S23 [Pipistrellus kuhlii]
MAGSRLETVGSVFSRTRDLMRAGVLKEKPLWFDIYAAFPPLREPVYRRPLMRYGKAKADIQDIFYHEDLIRAKFYSAYGSGQKAFDLFNPNFKSTCQRFVEKYLELQKLGETDEEKLFVEAGKALLAEGVILRRVGEARAVSIVLSKLLLGLVVYLSEIKGRLGFLSPTLSHVPELQVQYC